MRQPLDIIYIPVIRGKNLLLGQKNLSSDLLVPLRPICCMTNWMKWNVSVVHFSSHHQKEQSNNCNSRPLALQLELGGTVQLLEILGTKKARKVVEAQMNNILEEVKIQKQNRKSVDFRN
ncbi:unnamed protein product [Amoebophrya sp. A25]|nr:unnamed protein product [Amoebophrya sp. A25]|eukprot:GSA25T00001663001.1